MHAFDNEQDARAYQGGERVKTVQKIVPRWTSCRLRSHMSWQLSKKIVICGLKVIITFSSVEIAEVYFGVKSFLFLDRALEE